MKASELNELAKRSRDNAVVNFIKEIKDEMMMAALSGALEYCWHCKYAIGTNMFLEIKKAFSKLGYTVEVDYSLRNIVIKFY